MSLPYTGAQHRELMLRYRRLSQFGIMVSDHDSPGLVRERLGLTEIRYDLGPRDTATFKRAIELLCEVYFAAGARVVYPPVEQVTERRAGAPEPLSRADVRPRNL